MRKKGTPCTGTQAQPEGAWAAAAAAAGGGGSGGNALQAVAGAIHCIASTPPTKLTLRPNRASLSRTTMLLLPTLHERPLAVLCSVPGDVALAGERRGEEGRLAGSAPSVAWRLCKRGEDY